MDMRHLGKCCPQCLAGSLVLPLKPRQNRSHQHREDEGRDRRLMHKARHLSFSLQKPQRCLEQSTQHSLAEGYCDKF